MGPRDTEVTKEGSSPHLCGKKTPPLSNPDRGQNSALRGEAIQKVRTWHLPHFPERALGELTEPQSHESSYTDCETGALAVL